MIALIAFFMLIIPHNAFSDMGGDIQITAPIVPQQNAIKIVIINEANLSENKISVIKQAIESDQHYTSNGQIYFEGWYGAMQALDPQTNPTQFEISESEKKISGEITIELVKNKNPNYNGFTIPYYAGKKMISASIQIFDPNSLSSIQLENVVRHEFGHALGLGHATEQDAMMYGMIDGWDKEFITGCDMVGLRGLTEGLTFTNLDCTGA